MKIKIFYIFFSYFCALGFCAFVHELLWFLEFLIPKLPASYINIFCIPGYFFIYLLYIFDVGGGDDLTNFGLGLLLGALSFVVMIVLIFMVFLLCFRSFVNIFTNKKLTKLALFALFLVFNYFYLLFLIGINSSFILALGGAIALKSSNESLLFLALAFCLSLVSVYYVKIKFEN